MSASGGIDENGKRIHTEMRIANADSIEYERREKKTEGSEERRIEWQCGDEGVIIDGYYL